MVPAANDDNGAPAGLQAALDALHDPRPVSDLERARHERLIREQKTRERRRTAEPPEAA